MLLIAHVAFLVLNVSLLYVNLTTGHPYLACVNAFSAGLLLVSGAYLMASE